MANLVVHDDTNYDHFLYLVKKANKGKSQTEDVRELKVFIDEHPELLSDSLSITNMVMKDLIEKLFTVEAEKTIMQASVERMKAEFGYQQVSVIERMLIDTILVSWVRLQYLEGKFSQLCREGMTNSEGHFYNRLISAANLRFTRAVDTLGRLKKFHINFQVNIAAEGGKQINIQDNNSNSTA